MPKNWCFQIVVLEKTLESPLNSKRSNQSILKEINPEYSLEGLMLKLQYFSHLMQRVDSLAAAAAESLQLGPTLCDPIPPLGFSRQEHWSGLPLPSPMHESEK